MANGLAPALERNEGRFRGFQVIEPETPDESLLTWSQRRSLDLHITTMTAPAKPYWNNTMVGTWVSVVGLILVLVGIIAGGAFYMGAQHQKYEQMNERLKKAEEDAQKAKMLEAAKAGQEVGHDKPKENK